MSDDQERLRQLLDGELSSDDIAADPLLAKLAERIYGEDFLDDVGVSRGEAKRALTESLTDEDDDDLLFEMTPGELPEPEPFEHPESKISEPPAKSKGRKSIFFGGGGLLVVLANLFGAFGFLGSNCTGGGCPSDGQTRINWLSLGDISSTGWGWSPSIMEGSIGIPDIVALSICLYLLLDGFLKRRS